MVSALWQVVAAYISALVGESGQRLAGFGAQATLRADQFRSRNTTWSNDICDTA
jgi:hypothetical protein